MKTTKKKSTPAKMPTLSSIIKLEPEIQNRLNALSKLNKTTKPQTIAMIINWYFTRIDSNARAGKETRTTEVPTQVRSLA